MTVCLGHIHLRTSLKLAFVPGRHFNATKGATHRLKTPNDCVDASFTGDVMFHNKAILDSASVPLQDVSSCTLLFIRSQGWAMTFFFVQITLYIVIILNAL